MKGWVYVMTNPSMPGLIKVGFSMSDPELRAQELANTGVPGTYLVEYEVLTNNPFRVEQAAHARLSHRHEGKEWFRCATEEAVASIRVVVGGDIINEEFKKASRQKALEIQRKWQAEISTAQAKKDAEELAARTKIETELARKQENRRLAIEPVLAQAEKNDRICLVLQSWMKLYKMLPGKTPNWTWTLVSQVVLNSETPPEEAWVPHHPIFVGPISLKALPDGLPEDSQESLNAKAKAVLREHIEWAFDHGCLDKVASFLYSLPEKKWFHRGEQR